MVLDNFTIMVAPESENMTSPTQRCLVNRMWKDILGKEKKATKHKILKTNRKYIIEKPLSQFSEEHFHLQVQ